MAGEEFETNENDEEELYQSTPPIDDYIYPQDNNSGQVQGNNSRKESLKQAKQIQNNLGSQALQRMGVPKHLSNYVSKHGDGFFSPNNNLANKMLKKQGQNLIANQIENRKKIENGEEEQKSVVDQVANKAVEKGGSMALQAAGVPKPIADAVSQKLAGPAT